MKGFFKLLHRYTHTQTHTDTSDQVVTTWGGPHHIHSGRLRAISRKWNSSSVPAIVSHTSSGTKRPFVSLRKKKKKNPCWFFFVVVVVLNRQDLRHQLVVLQKIDVVCVWNFSLFSQHTDRPIPSLEHFTLGGKKRKEKREERESFSISFLGRSEPAASKTGSSSRTWNSVPSVAGRSTTHTHDLLCYKSFSWWSFSCVIWNWRNNINNRMSYRGYVSHIPLFPWVDFNYTWWPYPIVCAKSVTVITRDIYARYYYYYYKSEPIQSDPFAHHYRRWHIWYTQLNSAASQLLL